MKRILSTLSCSLLAGFAMAGEGLAGTKLGGDFAGQSASASPGVGFGALLQMLFALAIVGFLLKWALPKLAGKLGKKLVTSDKQAIQIEEGAQFAGGSLYIVKARGKELLISVAGTSVTMLTELGPVQAATPIVDPFEIALQEAQARPTPTTAELEARAALDRLTQLTSNHVNS